MYKEKLETKKGKTTAGERVLSLPFFKKQTGSNDVSLPTYISTTHTHWELSKRAAKP
jgi:hypothetical protein